MACDSPSKFCSQTKGEFGMPEIFLYGTAGTHPGRSQTNRHWRCFPSLGMIYFPPKGLTQNAMLILSGQKALQIFPCSIHRKLSQLKPWQELPGFLENYSVQTPQARSWRGTARYPAVCPFPKELRDSIFKQSSFILAGLFQLQVSKAVITKPLSQEVFEAQSLAL